MQKTKGNKKNPQKSTINLKSLPPIDPSIISPIYQDKYEDLNFRNEPNLTSLSSWEGKGQLAGGFDEIPRHSDTADRNVLRQNMKVEEEEDACLSLSSPSSSSTKLRGSNITLDSNFNKQNQKCFHRKTAKSELHQLCASKNWKLPLYECWKEEGPPHMKLFTFKVVVEIQETSSSGTILECFGDSKPNKKMSAENAAEGALWYLRHLGYYSLAKSSKTC